MCLTVATGGAQAPPGRQPDSAGGWMSAAGTMASMIGRLHHLILDCADPLALATFYSELLGQPITYRSEDFVVVAENDTTSGLAFQFAPDHQPPDWPDPARPQQMHFDVMVEDGDVDAQACDKGVVVGVELGVVFGDQAGCFQSWCAPLLRAPPNAWLASGPKQSVAFSAMVKGRSAARALPLARRTAPRHGSPRD